ncbi:hypothetical protein G6F37_009344 [Rhizopus arrhizus]|nr:hypothetical protein G6F38_009731 [Rhizopus arrhizus]KAG1154560.1 hypothetical protein G6F37_009344 [Rhizopus arrhizus]
MNATFENNIHNSQQDKCPPGHDRFHHELAATTTKKGSRKIAEIKFDPLDPAIDHILKDGITFENDAAKLLSCRALDPAVPLVRLRLSNLPFLKEEILKEKLKMSLKVYGSVLDLGILRKSHTGTYMGTGYAILSSEYKGFYAVWSDVPTYCRYCHAEGHTVPDCPKKCSFYVCWNCRASGHVAAECDRVNQDEIQSSQASSGITMPSTSP